MGFFKSKKSMVACTNNHNARTSRLIDNILAEQCSVAFYICAVLEFLKVLNLLNKQKIR
ncbi:hypothetical protein KY348_03980 [Candidatus Woesearchaeota archaeon]|nr:hypothetical protein [Candidatus Woesearchaeota archaeon]